MITRKTDMHLAAPIVSALCALALAAAPAAAQTVEKTVKIGMVMTLSGPLAAQGDNIDKGSQLYLKLHEAELPKGVKVEMLRRDDTGNPDAARRVAQELVTRDRVQFLAGVSLTPNAAAMAPLATEAKVPLVLMNATTSNLTRLSPYIARVSFTQWQLSYTMGEWAAHHGYKRVFVAVVDFAPGVDAEQAFIKGFTQNGGEIAGTVRMPLGTMEFAPYWERVKEARPDALYLFTNNGRFSTAAVKAYANVGLRDAGIALLGPGDIVDDNELPNMGDAVLGTVTAGHYSAHNQRPQNLAFIAAWKKEYGEGSTPNFMAVAAWDGMAAIFTVIRELKGEISGDAAIDILRRWKSADSPRGPIAVDPETRDIVQDVYIDKVEKVGNLPASVQIDVLEHVKDPWKILNP
jgi:branched-chain amino acid transport system substrate-binding protein